MSLWQFTNNLLPKETGTTSPLEETFDKFCRGVSMYGPFWDHVLGYYKASLEMPHKVFFLTYEEMKEKPREQLKRWADFLGCPFSEDEEEVDGGVNEILRLSSFDNLSKLDVNQNRKLSTGHENKSFF
ncbi:cytosolic sulfotransferase 5-like [Punica granatum]|uniref:Sulfotransferase n=1 Tax=Punica granatum TaxID=22663 RepID=A0A6P8BX46_PUNGR|nr:cytosolic sulfotransferase 5-like [Punica granatum]